MSAKGTTWKKRNPEKIPDSIMNLCESLKGEIELYKSIVKELEELVAKWMQKCANEQGKHREEKERNKVLEDALRKIDAISFHKNDWEEMCKIGEIAKEALLNNHK